MSRAANDWAWSLDVKPASLKLLLLAMADRADEEHCCFPSIERMEKDTGLNRKTILGGIKKLVEAGVLKDTGDRRGRTQRVIVYKLIGVDSGIKRIHTRKETVPKTEQYQKRNDTENGTLNGTENGTLNRPENGTQNQSVEPVIEPIKDLVPSKLETEPVTDPVLFEIPLKGKTDKHLVTKSELFELRKLYPAVDVGNHLNRMISWCERHPNRQKTKRGVKDFIHNWLSQEQDRGRPAPQQGSHSSADDDELQDLKRKIGALEMDINNENSILVRFEQRKGEAAKAAAESSRRKISEWMGKREALKSELSELSRGANG